METVKTRQRRPVYWCNFYPSPNCVGMDIGRGSGHSHQVKPANEQDIPRESSLCPPRSAVLTFQQLVDIAEGLNYLHECDVVHGDLKGVSSPPLPNSSIADRTRAAEHHGGR